MEFLQNTVARTPFARMVGLALLLAVPSGAPVHAAGDANAVALRAKYAALTEPLRTNAFQRPLVIQSSDTGTAVRGDVYAVLDFPFDRVRAGLMDPEHWCDFMMLHINTKYCRTGMDIKGPVLRLNVGKKTQEALASTSPLAFSYRVDATGSGYLGILLDADAGPMDTHTYRMTLEATPVQETRTFLHIAYAYSIGTVGRLAMRTYLATAGKDKVGFTVIPATDFAAAAQVGGLRGAVERNTMRYYLAISSYLESADGAPAGRQEKRLRSWFAAAEKYPLQLHEMDLPEYLNMKHAELARQSALGTPR